MSFKVILDSCGDLTKELKEDARIQKIPLLLQIGDYHTPDDDTFDQADFIRRIAESQECPKSACPSPEQFMDAYHCEADDIYVITLSANLSGSYNSAELGKKLYEEKYGKKNIHVFDSCSASIGETQIAFKIMEYINEGKQFDEVVKLATTYRDEQQTYFILDNLDTLRKNGRLSKVKSVVASTLNLKPIMGSTDEGTIVQLGQTIGMKKALIKMSNMIASKVKEPGVMRVMISHCNCPERALQLKEIIESKADVKEILIVDTAGISTMYANDGGIIATI